MKYLSSFLLLISCSCLNSTYDPNSKEFEQFTGVSSINTSLTAKATREDINNWDLDSLFWPQLSLLTNIEARNISLLKTNGQYLYLLKLNRITDATGKLYYEFNNTPLRTDINGVLRINSPFKNRDIVVNISLTGKDLVLSPLGEALLKADSFLDLFFSTNTDGFTNYWIAKYPIPDIGTSPLLCSNNFINYSLSFIDSNSLYTQNIITISCEDPKFTFLVMCNVFSLNFR